MIPKIIHYIWFGRNPKPDIVLHCIASWKKYMPDFEIREWNEDNYDVQKIDYIKEAYGLKKWAFVSDYVRFDVLNQYGGIYFDTDVELLKPVPAEILEKPAFTGMESAGMVSPGLVFATEPRTLFLREILRSYEKAHFLSNGEPVYKTVNEFTTELLIPGGFVFRNIYQEVFGLSIYPSAYFCGFDLDVHEYDIRPETISVHHYAGTWREDGFKQKLRRFLKKAVGVENYRKIVMLKRRICQ